MLKKALLVVVGLVVLALGGGAVLALAYQPKQRPAPAIDIERSAERLARGKYLVDHVVGCLECHTKRDFSRYGGPMVGPPGGGGDCYGSEAGMPGTVCPSNITPHPTAGIGAWSDGEILRSIREGVDRDGEALFPWMPFPAYRRLSDEDAQAIVAYLRTVPPSPGVVPDSRVDFPVNFFIKLLPTPLEGPVAPPAATEGPEYGDYLATIAGCRHCHTPIDDQGQPLPGRELAGGHAFTMPWGRVVSANLTPHETGLTMPRESFIALFKAFAAPEAAAKVDPADNTVMPWLTYAGMTESDLGSIYDYLRTVAPIDNRVERLAGTERLADTPPR